LAWLKQHLDKKDCEVFRQASGERSLKDIISVTEDVRELTTLIGTPPLSWAPDVLWRIREMLHHGREPRATFDQHRLACALRAALPR
jgi:hypothetical protein